MGQLIATVAFDALFIQFYNTPACSARGWVNANPNYTPGTRPASAGGFTFDAWATAVAGGASSAAKLYIGLPGSADAVDDVSYYLNQTESQNLVDAYFCNRQFGGVAIYDASYADENLDSGGLTFTQSIKTTLTDALANPLVRNCRGAATGEKA